MSLSAVLSGAKRSGVSQIFFLFEDIPSASIRYKYCTKSVSFASPTCAVGWRQRVVGAFQASYKRAFRLDSVVLRVLAACVSRRSVSRVSLYAKMKLTSLQYSVCTELGDCVL